MLAEEFIVIDHMAETLTGVVLQEDSMEGRKKGEAYLLLL